MRAGSKPGTDGRPHQRTSGGRRFWPRLSLRYYHRRTLRLFRCHLRITAEEAADWGLVWSAVADDAIDDEVERIASVLKRSSPGTVTRIRQTVDSANHNSFSDQLDLEMDHQAVLIPRNMREGARAFMEKREPVFSGQRDL